MVTKCVNIANDFIKQNFIVSAMKNIRKIFIRGLLTITPLVLTIGIVTWLFSLLEDSFSVPIKAVIGPEHYFKGLGVIVALVLIFVVGLIINHWIIKKLYDFGEKILERIPLIKSIYTSIKDLISFFHSDNRLNESLVVSFEIAGMRLLGLVTRDDFSDIPEGLAQEGDVAVYLPMSYQIGGYTIIVPRSKIKKVDMSVEDSMRYIVTAGILGGKKT